MANILVIEDDPRVRTSYRLALKKAGHDVSLAGNGEAGLLYMASSREFDLIVLDLGMPGVTGEEFLSQYQQTTPVIISTGRDLSEFPTVSQHPSVKACLQKPHAVEDLLDAVNEVLSQDREQVM